MVIPIHIPIGIKRVAAIRGAVWKFVSCSHCQQQYAYLLELEATGEDHDLLFLDAKGSAERAQAQAEHNLLQKGRNVVLPVPCPSCGTYQDDMLRLLEEDASINHVQVFGLVIALLSFIPLLFDMEFNWVLTLIVAAVGITVAAYGTVRSLQFDPNEGNPDSRIALGKQHAVWGEQLKELLAMTRSAEQGPSAERRSD